MATNGLKPSNFKDWLWSAKVLATIVWILFPLGFGIIGYIYQYLYTMDQSTKDPNPFITNWRIENLHILDISFNVYITPILLMALLLLFAVFPAIYPSKKLFRKKGDLNVVIEYEYIRKIFYVSLAVSIISMILFYTFLQKGYSETLNNLKDQYSLSLALLVGAVVYLLIVILPAISTFILIKLLLLHARKQFRFYYAKACFKILNETKSETDKAEYLHLGLDWYNKFVKRVTKSGIDIETIYSKLISNSQLSNNILLDTITDSFHSGDELKPMRHMLALLSCWKEGATLVKESLKTRIRESSDLLLPILGVIITIITTFFLRTPPTQGNP